MSTEPCAFFMPASGPDSLVPFQIRPSDGKVNIGRGALTGINSTFVSRKLGNVWIDDSGTVRFDKIAPAAMFVVKNKAFIPLELGVSVIDSGLSGWGQRGCARFFRKSIEEAFAASLVFSLRFLLCIVCVLCNRHWTLHVAR